MRSELLSRRVYNTSRRQSHSVLWCIITTRVGRRQALDFSAASTHVPVDRTTRRDMSSLASVTAPPPLCRARERCSGARPGPSAAPVRTARCARTRRRRPRPASRDDPEALDTVEAHFSPRGADLYAATPEVTAAVRTMVASKRTDGKTLSEVLDASDGVWEVFDMPHMRKLSAGARRVQACGTPCVTASSGATCASGAFRTRSHGRRGFGGGQRRGGVKVSPSATTPWVIFPSFWVARDGETPRHPPRSALRSPRRD